MRVDADGNRMRFTSAILPPYLRRTKAIGELVPWLYLKGISTGDFPDALQALLGPDAEGLRDEMGQGPRRVDDGSGEYLPQRPVAQLLESPTCRRLTPPG